MDYSQGDYEYNENEEYEDEESIHGGSERMYQNKRQYDIDKEGMYEEEEEEDDDDEFKEFEFSVNHSCIEPLVLKKMQENDLSYIRRTMSANDISTYEKNIAYQRQYEEDEEEDEGGMEREYQPGSSSRGGYTGKSNHSHDANYSAQSQEDKYHSNRDDALLNSNNIQYPHIEELENNDNLKETPIKNVSHISEVSKSKENSEHQHHNKIHSNNSKTKTQQEKDINQDYFSQSKEDAKQYNNNNSSSQQYQQQQIDNDNDNNEEQTHSIITYDDKDKNSISQNESHREHNYNDDNDNDDVSHERKYIGGDYEDDDSMEVVCVSFANSEPPLQRKLKLSEPTESVVSIDSFRQHLQDQEDQEDREDQDDEGESNEQAKITYPTTYSQQLPDIDASVSQNSMYDQNMKTSLSNLDDNNKSNLSKDAQHSKRSSNKKPKGVTSNKSNISSNRSSTNKKKQNYQHSKSSNRSLMNGTRSDISKSSFRSNNQNNSNSKHNKSSTSSLLDEISLTDEEVKNELIKMTKKIYGNKLTPYQLQQSEEMFIYIIYNIKEALNSNNNNENDNEKYITKEFLLKHEKQLHALIVSHIDSLKKKSNIKSQNMKTIARNIPTIKYIRELQIAQTAERIKRKQQGLLEESGKIMQRDFEYFGAFYNQAYQLEEMRCNDEMRNIEIKRQRVEEEKNKLFAENIKYFSDKIGILSYLLAREKKKNTTDKKRKESYLHSLKYLTKHEKRKLFEREIERIDEEDQREEDNVDNKQEQIQNLVNTYYSKK